MISAAGAALYLCIALCVAAAVSDIRFRRLPNLLCAAIALAAMAASYFAGGLQMLGLSALHALAALLVGMGLFAGGLIGAGDAKMYSSVAFAVAPGSAFELLGWTSLAGLGVVGVMTVAKLARGKPLRDMGKSFTVPFAVPIAIGFAITALS